MQFMDILFNESSVVCEVRFFSLIPLLLTLFHLFIHFTCVQVLNAVKFLYVRLNIPSINNSHYFIFILLKLLLDLTLIGVYYTYRSLGFKTRSDQELLCLIALWWPLLSWCRKRWIEVIWVSQYRDVLHICVLLVLSTAVQKWHLINL